VALTALPAVLSLLAALTLAALALTGVALAGLSAMLLLSVLGALALLLVLAVRLVVLRTHCCSSLECREYISRAVLRLAAISAPSAR
jgi:hypothetical protein